MALLDLLVRNVNIFCFKRRRKSCLVSLFSLFQWILLLSGISLVLGGQQQLLPIQVPVTEIEPEYCSSSEEIGPKQVLQRYIIDDVNQVKMPLTLIESDRVSHRLTNAIFKKFLKEKVGYQDVKYIYMDDKVKPDKPIIISEEGKKPPAGMVNLEVWISPGHSDHKGSIMDSLGTQGTGGRFGWFIKSGVNSPQFLSYWRSFQNEEVPKIFSLDDDQLKAVKDIYTKDKNGNYYCTSHQCLEGVFTPPLCKETKKCAMLFVGEFQMSEFLLKQVVQQKLFVEVAWIGSNLTPQFIERFRKGLGTLYFSWWPDPLAVLDGISSVSFPSCTEVDLALDNTYLCKYELHTIRKHAWKKLFDIATLAYEAIERFILQTSDYRYLLHEYNSRTRFDESEPLVREKEKGWDTNIIEDIATEWMNLSSNSQFINIWKPSGYNVKPKLWLAGIFPLNGSLERYTSKTLVYAARLAICDINSNSTILGNYTIELMIQNGGCASDVVLFSYINYIRAPSLNMDHLIGILGPSCSDTVEPLAGISKLFRTVMISYSAEGAIFNDQLKYPYFFRTIPENKLFKWVYLHLFNTLEWKRVASLTEVGNKYSEYLTHLQDDMQTENITITNRQFPKENADMEKYLRNLKDNNYRIIIGDFYSKKACEIFCQAYKLKMTAEQGYIWFIPRWFESKWFDTDNRFSCSTEDMLHALDGHLSLGYAYLAPDNVKYHSGKTVGEWKKRYEQSYPSPLADYAGYTYDAVWAYAFALHKLLEESITHAANLHSITTNTRFVEILRKTNFMGVSGDVNFKRGASRTETVVHVHQFRSDYDALTGAYEIVGTFTHNSTHKYGGTFELNSSAIRWLNPGGKIPLDGSPPEQVCALAAFSRLLGLDCELTIVITMLISFVVFVVLFVIAIIYKIKYEKVEAPPWQRDRMPDLDEWEITRDRVVSNRTIGTGTFGIVYGGECRVKEDGPWDAVAVKTLKEGSTMDNKLDFLGEADLMKKFDHKNIVKLIGLATRVEPFYMIMEFMLYGDLKTYLLARRHLVSDREINNDDDEISNRRLTSMALDVVCGLDYLATNNYVHRDVACRNCLVNTDRVVKLSDFGMTRSIFESNYYRYNRKGMVPVRWMAPESIEDGIYTTMSDVWSFGVLLYEIITFGNFPFQGLSNDQVLQHVVKYKKTIKVPHDVKYQLKQILHRCWRRKPELRLTYEELMAILSNSSRLIEPCLDVPTASVDTNDVSRPDCKIVFSPNSSSQKEVVSSPTRDLDNNSVFSTNSVVHPRRSRYPMEMTNIEPLLPVDSYISRYACLQMNCSPDATEVDPPSGIGLVA